MGAGHGGTWGQRAGRVPLHVRLLGHRPRRALQRAHQGTVVTKENVVRAVTFDGVVAVPEAGRVAATDQVVLAGEGVHALQVGDPARRARPARIGKRHNGCLARRVGQREVTAQHIVAAVAFQVVGLAATGDEVAAILAVQHVHARAAGDPVVPETPIYHGRKVVALHDPPGDGVPTRRGEPNRGPGRSLARCRPQQHTVVAQRHIVTRPAVHRVRRVELPARTGQHRAAAADEVVVAAVTLDPVYTLAALGVVVFAVAFDAVDA